MLIGNNVPFDLPSALEQAAPLQPIPISQQQIQQVTDFVIRRLEQVLVDGGASIEAVRAVLRQRGKSPALAAASVHQLQVCFRQHTHCTHDALMKEIEEDLFWNIMPHACECWDSIGVPGMPNRCDFYGQGVGGNLHM